MAYPQETDLLGASDPPSWIDQHFLRQDPFAFASGDLSFHNVACLLSASLDVGGSWREPSSNIAIVPGYGRAGKRTCGPEICFLAPLKPDRRLSVSVQYGVGAIAPVLAKSNLFPAVRPGA